MIRKLIKINEEKCNGCGACANACHEGAIEMVNGKAKLMREDFCDGFGDCLPSCPTGAITFEEREAPAYDEAAVQAAKQKKTGNEIYLVPTTCEVLHKIFSLIIIRIQRRGIITFSFTDKEFEIQLGHLLALQLGVGL